MDTERDVNVTRRGGEDLQRSFSASLSSSCMHGFMPWRVAMEGGNGGWQWRVAMEGGNAANPLCRVAVPHTRILKCTIFFKMTTFTIVTAGS